MARRVSEREMREFLGDFEQQVDLDALSSSDRESCRYWLRYEAPRWADTVSLVLASSPRRVLDVGCDFGVCALFMIRRLGLEVVGLELPSRAADLGAYWQANGLDVRPCDIIADPLPCEPVDFDVIVATEVIEHLRCPPETALKRLVPLLEPGGRLVVTTPNVCRLSNIVRLIEGRNLTPPLADVAGQTDAHPTDDWYHLRELTPREAVEALEAAGLTDVHLHMSACWDGPRSSGARSLARKLLKTAWYPVAKVLPRRRACIMAVGTRGEGG